MTRNWSKFAHLLDNTVHVPQPPPRRNVNSRKQAMYARLFPGRTVVARTLNNIQRNEKARENAIKAEQNRVKERENAIKVEQNRVNIMKTRKRNENARLERLRKRNENARLRKRNENEKLERQRIRNIRVQQVRNKTAQRKNNGTIKLPHDILNAISAYKLKENENTYEIRNSDVSDPYYLTLNTYKKLLKNGVFKSPFSREKPAKLRTVRIKYIGPLVPINNNKNILKGKKIGNNLVKEREKRRHLINNSVLGTTNINEFLWRPTPPSAPRQTYPNEAPNPSFLRNRPENVLRNQWERQAARALGLSRGEIGIRFPRQPRPPSARNQHTSSSRLSQPRRPVPPPNNRPRTAYVRGRRT